MSEPVYVCGINASRWHIAGHDLAGYGVTALCGCGWRESCYLARTGFTPTETVCKRCLKRAGLTERRTG